MGDTASFGYWVRRRRKALDLTQPALAGLVGCSVAMLKKLEADERRPSLQLAERLAVYLRIPPAEQAAFLASARGREVPPESLTPLEVPSRVPPSSSRLPAEPTSFIGRADELRRIAAALADPACRLLTVTGPGGIGKSRLALRAAMQVPMAHGAWWVPLAEITTPALLAAAILERLPRQTRETVDPAAALLATLAPCAGLLVLDNFEQLLIAAPGGASDAVGLVLRLLEHCPGLTLLVTSRERLNVQAEWLLPLRGLPLDDAASALFAARARQVQPGFVLAGQEDAVAEICRLVDGLPLAVELAAGWTHALSCAQIAQQIQHRPAALATHLRDVPARHRSVDAVFTQTWQVLSTDERSLWMQLAVFHDGCTVEELRAVCGADLATVRALVDKSLLSAGSDGRYQLHPLARHYAGRQLAASGMVDALRRRHLAVYLALAEQAAAHFSGPEAEPWLQRLDRELSNLRAAWDWAVQTAEPATLYRLVRPVSQYWQWRGYFQEGAERLAQLLARTAGDAGVQHTEALIRYATLLAFAGHVDAALPLVHTAYERAVRGDDPYVLGLAALNLSQVAQGGTQRLAYARAAVAALRTADDPMELGGALWLLGDELRTQGALAEARAAYTESLAVLRALGNPQVIVYPLGNLGRLALLEGNVPAARRSFAECVALARQSGNRVTLADWLLRLGVADVYAGRLAEARKLLEEARRLAHDMTHQLLLVNVLAWQALEAVAAGDRARAREALKLSLDGYRRLVASELEQPEVIEALLAAAQLQLAEHRAELAAMALGGAAQLEREQGYRLEPPLAGMLAGVGDTVRATLSEAAWQAHWEQGRTLPVGDVLARLAGGLGPS